MLIDVRTPEEYAEAHIDGAVNVELAEDMTSKLPAEAKGETLQLYCRSGGRAGAAEQILQQAGYKVENLGGVDDVLALGRTLVVGS
jgi:phage shock protein E